MRPPTTLFWRPLFKIVISNHLFYINPIKTKIRKRLKRKETPQLNEVFKNTETTQKYLEIPQNYLSAKRRKPLKNFRKRLKIKRKPLKNCVLRDFRIFQRNGGNN